jgi:hypothetical protein
MTQISPLVRTHWWIRQRQQTALSEHQLSFVSERLAALTASSS